MTMPLLPPPPCMRKSPSHCTGSASAKLIPNSSPPIPVRRFMMPSTRQYAGRGAVRDWLQGIGSVVPAAIAAAFVISTFGALKFVRLAQEFGWAEATLAMPRTTQSVVQKNCRFISPRLLVWLRMIAFTRFNFPDSYPSQAVLRSHPDTRAFPPRAAASDSAHHRDNPRRPRSPTCRFAGSNELGPMCLGPPSSHHAAPLSSTRAH